MLTTNHVEVHTQNATAPKINFSRAQGAYTSVNNNSAATPVLNTTTSYMMPAQAEYRREPIIEERRII